jgi:hypothetical protein
MDHTCSCAFGWSGADCSMPSCITPCLNNGTCIGGATQCSCGPDYTGSDCSLTVCDAFTCIHGSCTGPTTCYCNTGMFHLNMSVISMIFALY